MHIGKETLFRLTAGLVAVLAIALVVVGLGFTSGSTSAQEGETAATVNNGEFGGVNDILVGDLATSVSFFYCISKTDHDATTNAIVVHSQCNIDFEGGTPETTNTPPSWTITCVALEEANAGDCPEGSLRSNSSETGADVIPGPPPPPPYTSLAPQTGLGAFYPAGTPIECNGTPCILTASCFEDTGPVKGTGPNIISETVTLDPANPVTVAVDGFGDVDQVTIGSVKVWYNQNNANCAALTPKGLPFIQLPLFSIGINGKGGSDVNPNPAPWRVANAATAVERTIVDFDGDGCTDEQELDPKGGGKCGDDPQNPSDSFDSNTVDLSGIYGILTRIVRGDCTDAQCTTNAPGIYFFCRADIQHDTGDNTVVARVYCYTDSTLDDVNSEAYPGITGDGMAGGPPPGPETVTGNGNYAFGDVDTKHAEFTGTFNKETNNLEISGCFSDEDAAGALGNVYVELTLSAHQLPGSVDLWIQQDLDCVGSPGGDDPTFDDADTTSWQPNPAKGKGYDQDGDGVPTERELQDDADCGRRDPYNKNDYYDVSIPRDGVIDLPNDILGVIIHFQPGGYPAGDENWDRPPKMIGAGVGSTWNRGSPDGVIDLPNDILGVILQFNPGGCPPLS